MPLVNAWADCNAAGSKAGRSKRFNCSPETFCSASAGVTMPWWTSSVAMRTAAGAVRLAGRTCRKNS